MSVVGLGLELATRSTPVAVDFGSRGSTTASAIVFMALPIVGALIVWRQSRQPVGWLFIAIGATMAIWVLADGAAIYTLRYQPGAFGGGDWMAWVASWVWAVGWTLTGLVFLIFPTGRLLGRRWRLAIWALVVVGVAVVAITALTDGYIENYRFVSNPAGVIQPGISPYSVKLIGVLALAVVGLPAVGSLVVRLRGADAEQRQQIKWVVWAASVTVGTIFAMAVARGLGARIDWLESAVLGVAVLIPISAGFAVLRYRLYGIDVIINKTVVFGVLAAFVTAVYVVVVVGVGSLLGLSDSRPGLSIFATALVAVAFDPARTRAQRVANRIVYGDRATPYEALAALSHSMSVARDPDETLPQLAAVVGGALGACSTGIWLELDGVLRRAASWPAASEGPITDETPDNAVALGSEAEMPVHANVTFFPVRHQGDVLGAVSVRMDPTDRLDPGRAKLVSDLALQAGLMLRNLRLVADLRASRHRIVSAGDAERRRLERDLHDGAQQELVALTIKLGLTQRLLDKDPEAARRMMDELRGEASDALGTLRDLAHGIYPPLLADAGLVPALDAQASKAAVAVVIDADSIRRYPQDVEVAVYFCCLEAMQNVAKYAPEASVVIQVSCTQGDISFAVRDDGPGFDRAAPRGAGLQNMTDRLAALGGELEIESAPGCGATIRGRIPATPLIDLTDAAPLSSLTRPEPATPEVAPSLPATTAVHRSGT